MKKTLLIAVLAILMSGLYAQRDGVAPLPKGGLQLNFGTGISDRGLPVYASLDIGLHKDVTLTPEVHVRFPTNDEDKMHAGAMVKADYHWNYLIGIPNNWDFYSGARAGFNFGDDDFILDLGIQVGGRWYWSESWGLNLEIAAGYGLGATFGLSWKLKQ